MLRLTATLSTTLKAAFLALGIAAAMGSAPAAAQGTSAQAQMQVRATVLSTCSVRAGGQLGLSCVGAAEPVVETGTPVELGEDGGAVAVTTVNF